MRQQVIVMAAAAVVAGSVWTWGQQDETRSAVTSEQRTTATDTRQASAPTLPAGITAKELDEQKDIANAFEAVAKSVMDKEEDSLINRLVDADRNRIRANDREDVLKEALAKADALKQQWKTKYDKDFDPGDETFTGAGFMAVATGEVSDPAQLAGHWPVRAGGMGLGGAAEPAGARTAPDQAGTPRAEVEVERRADGAVTGERRETDRLFGGDVNLDKGRNVAVVKVPASHGLPEVTASLIHELPDIWRFDLPDTVTADKLRDNLSKQLDAMAKVEQWPADREDAYRMVAHRVLMALYDVQETATGTSSSTGG